MYAIKITCKEAKAFNGRVMMVEGTVMWVHNSVFYPTIRYGTAPSLLVFKYAEEAEDFINNWKPHPWYCTPKKIEAVKVIPQTIPKVIEYKEVNC